MEHLVPSLDTCKRLKEAGFPQSMSFSWFDIRDVAQREAGHTIGNGSGGDYSAPTAQELADQLPHSTHKDNSLELWSWSTPTGKKWNASYVGKNRVREKLSAGDTMAEALAALWL